MKFGRRIAVGVLSCVLLAVVVLAFAGCASDQKKAADTYFKALSPVIAKDSVASTWADQVIAQWTQKYQSTLATSREGWTAFASILGQMVVKAQDIQKAVEAVTPPPAFKAAHGDLVQSNRAGIAWAQSLAAAINANRPVTELASMVETGPAIIPDATILAKFKAAAAAVGVTLPADLVKDLTDTTSSTTTSS